MTRRYLRDRSDLLWASWLGAVLASFGAIETVAYFTERPQTLSRSLRRWFGIEPRSRWHYAAVATFCMGCLALLAHLETLHQLHPAPADTSREVPRC